MRFEELKVGELAERTGVTVRTLHHYHEIGLLTPAHHSAGGHRVYSTEHVERLLRIKALQQLGMSLDEIRACLDSPEHGLAPLLERRIAHLEERIEADRRLLERMTALSARMRANADVTIDELARTIELMSIAERYYSAEQIESLAARRVELGEERIREVQAEWGELFDALCDAKDRGLAPNHATVLALARRGQALVREFTGGDAGIAASLSAMYAKEPAVHAWNGADRGLMAYYGEACRALAGERAG